MILINRHKHSIDTFSGIKCDICGFIYTVQDWDYLDELVDGVYELAFDEGWLKDDKDYCPKCVGAFIKMKWLEADRITWTEW